jgi:hypothetical protein
MQRHLARANRGRAVDPTLVQELPPFVPSAGLREITGDSPPNGHRPGK